MEGCPSGLRGRFAKPLARKRHTGSNPVPSANNKYLVTVLHTVYSLYMRDTQKKGDFAVAQAIATFTKMGHDVLIPLTESAAYDLAIDFDGLVKRIQVRFTSTNEVDLRRIHSNSTGYVVKKAKDNSYDWLYILHNNGNEYLIKQCLSNRRSIKPAENYLIEVKSSK